MTNALKTNATGACAPHKMQGPLRVRDSSLLGIIEFAETIAKSLHEFYEALDSSLYENFESIGADIALMRVEIAKLQAHDLSANRLPTVDDELDAILESATDATEIIMENAEAILAAEPKDLESYQDEVNERIIKVMEACAFHDLTGQRVSKVLETVRHIEARVSRFATAIGGGENPVEQSAEEAARAQRRSDLMLNGPQSKEDAIKQDEIDALLADD